MGSILDPTYIGKGEETRKTRGPEIPNSAFQERNDSFKGGPNALEQCVINVSYLIFIIIINYSVRVSTT